jgi:hypothetical protein
MPVLDSFYHSIWLHTWRFDAILGPQVTYTLPVSDFYIRIFSYILPVGTAYFALRHRRIPQSWRQVGWLLLAIALMFTASALSFAWQYPLWDWRVFKAKYLTPALLWLPYATAVLFADRGLLSLGAPTVRLLQRGGLLLLIAFMCTNHLLPVYCQKHTNTRWSPGWTDARQLESSTRVAGLLAPPAERNHAQEPPLVAPPGAVGKDPR